ncbi:hypothetical protein LAUMK4_00287 [Mycobacterium persicum]|uniref:Uncharacterized protein n=1 Tax=Mycobacterium persicum TaxID=1487726 RepID=A0ABY6RBY9_9MYCO|nr:hypothetical protein [Mycobacterium persicum]VAZ71068.1 hypothetical protein LAUMK15_00640 [Mycobacterium persicum]VAZ87179.1 hypothetical protein LAUMK4_00287 [Mycobacterium persicum]
MNENQKPTMTEQELWEWLHYDEGIPVSRRAIKHAVIDRRITPTRFGNNNYFSKQDGWDFVAAQKQPSATRFVGPNAHRAPKTAAVQ